MPGIGARRRNRRILSAAIAAPLLVLIGLMGGCGAHYVTPGGPADFFALGITREKAESVSDQAIIAKMNVQPAASFPAAIAVARVQAGGYRNYSLNAYGEGAFSVITSRDAERPDDFNRLSNLPFTRGVGPINRMVAPRMMNSMLDLRASAAELHADIILMYTLDTGFANGRTVIPALGVLTLGLFPNKSMSVVSTASAAFIDTRTGYVYGVAESTRKASRLSNAWHSSENADIARREAEAEAFESLVDEIIPAWTRIAQQYGPKGMESAEE